MGNFCLTAVAAVLAAGHVKVGAAPPDVLASIRVVDVKTGETIEQVLEADVAAGKVTRYAVDGGNLVRIGDAFEIIEEDREIRIEAIAAPTAEVADEVEADEHTA
jgi:hypothetical protein